MKLNDIVDLDTYPINQPDNQKYKDIINYNKKLLDNNGCCILKNFIKEESINRMKQEAERKLNKVYWTKDKHNPYFIKDDETLPKDHPKRIFTVRESGYINSDDLEQNSDLNHLHDSDEMLKFVSDCLGVYPLYKWVDPLGKNPYSIMHSGHYFPWHFDGNEFTLSILVQKSEKGGIFEYSPDLRSKDNENFENVTKVLRGDRGTVKSLDLKPGDLQIFKGRFSMHRVTKIEGKSSRYIALPCYVKDPYRVNKPEHSIQVYGKAMPIHYKRNNIEADGLTD
uniref:Fe2OG dioxygenase domain-containing protein n=1 Tax=uncultured marine microorganism HF4000_141F21 TaxID=455525 RepID=B3T2F9_9ZZZZ|nr:hypothetical protein ALOHA_HF4000141F21ctg1g34 [uncultured marine microorganism HF4000_141F21]